MKTNLEILIDELQAECDLLQEELNFCIYDSDFEGAHAFNKSLIYTRNQLRIAKNIQNPNWAKIEEHRRRIQQLEKLKEDTRFYKMMIQRLPEYQASLDELLAIPAKKYALEGEEIAASLEKLLMGEVTKVNLQISGNHDVEIRFKLNNKILYLQLITNINFADKTRRSAILKSIGFEIQQDNISMQILDFEQFRISDIIEILAQIIYDVLGFRGNEKAKIVIS